MPVAPSHRPVPRVPPPPGVVFEWKLPSQPEHPYASGHHSRLITVDFRWSMLAVCFEWTVVFRWNFLQHEAPRVPWPEPVDFRWNSRAIWIGCSLLSGSESPCMARLATNWQAACTARPREYAELMRQPFFRNWFPSRPPFLLLFYSFQYRNIIYRKAVTTRQ